MSFRSQLEHTLFLLCLMLCFVSLLFLTLFYVSRILSGDVTISMLSRRFKLAEPLRWIQCNVSIMRIIFYIKCLS